MTIDEPVAATDAEEYQRLLVELRRLRTEEKAAVRKRRQEDQLKPFQVELLQLQRHLEAHNRRKAEEMDDD